MLSDLPALFGAIALAAAGVPSAPGGTMLWIPLCHGGVIPIDLPGKTCPGGCHAACLTRKSLPGEEGDDG